MAKRLTSEDWINCGLKSLIGAGYESIRAGKLAQILGVSRGSFYWHFKEMADFENQLMSAWKSRTTRSVITQLENDQSHKSRLIKLVTLALSNDMKLDTAMRSWSMEDERANAIVAEVDNERILYLESLLEALGKSRQDVALQARVLYWSCIGRSVIERHPESALSSSDVKRLIKIFVD